MSVAVFPALSFAVTVYLYMPLSDSSEKLAFPEMLFSSFIFSANETSAIVLPSPSIFNASRPESASLAFAVRVGSSEYQPYLDFFPDSLLVIVGAICSRVTLEPSSVLAIRTSLDLFPNTSTAMSLTSCASIKVSLSGSPMVTLY